MAAALAGHGALVVDADRIARRSSPGELLDWRPRRPVRAGVLTAGVISTGRRWRPRPSRTTRPAGTSRRSPTPDRRASRRAVRDGASGPGGRPRCAAARREGDGAAYHLVLVVDAPVEVRVARLVGRGLSEADARAGSRPRRRRRSAAPLLTSGWTTPGRRPTCGRPSTGCGSSGSRHTRNLRVGRRVKRSDATTLSAPDPDWADQGARVVGRLRHVLRARAGTSSTSGRRRSPACSPGRRRRPGRGG